MKKLSIVYFVFSITLLQSCNHKERTKEFILKDVWKLDQAQINSFDPLDAYHALHIQLVKQLFNTLTDLDSTGKIVPSLAKSWHSKDGKTWLFNLREDVIFIQDSCFVNQKERLFESSDVKFTFERLLGKDSKSFGLSYFSNILGSSEYHEGKSLTIKGIKLINDYTLEFALINPDYNFPNLLSLPYCSIVKEKAIKFYDYKQHPVGTGPFKLGKYEANQLVTLIKNVDYWEKSGDIRLPLVNEVDITLSNDDNYSFLLFKNQKTDFLELNLPLVKQYENAKFSFSYRKVVFESVQLNFYLFNLDKIKDPEIRKGINYAIDRIKMQQLIGDNGTITHSLYPKIFNGISEPKEILNSKPEKAKELLKYPMILKLVAFDDILSRSLATQIKENLSKYNIKVEIESVPFSVLVDRLISGKYDLIELYWGMLYADVNHFLTPFKTSSFPPSGNNFNKYSNAELDKLLNEAPGKTLEEQMNLYKNAEEIILNDMPFLLVFYRNVINISDNSYKMPINPLLYKFYKNAIPIN
jgi:oligopeptide transport system substrate-binding protein